MDLRRIAFALLAPGALIFSARAAATLAGRDPNALPWAGPLTAAGGVLSLLGILLLVAATWRARDGATSQVAATLVIVGHFGVSAWLPDAGAAMVYLGTGVAAASGRRVAGWWGAVAAIGAITRATNPTIGQLFIVLGAGITGGVLLKLALLPQRLYKNR